MLCIYRLCLLIASIGTLLVAGPALPVHSRPLSPTVTDSIYNAHHPRLLYNSSEIPGLFAKVRDGGHDDTAYTFIRILIQYIYLGSSPQELLGDDFGLSTIPNLGVGTELESPPDETARELGRTLTVYLADNWNPDTDDFYSSLRLRALTLGYDMFFAYSDDAERAYIRDEILSYVTYMLTQEAYDVWSFRPYLSNRSAMIAASLGLAAICLDGEADSLILQAAFDRSSLLIERWLNYHVDN
ncbi:MAG: hypothetical protein JSW50_01165, partial [Candidatus Latescibacterota bacterium]